MSNMQHAHVNSVITFINKSTGYLIVKPKDSTER